MKVVVDQEQCCGAGLCAATAPEVFAQRAEDGRVVLLQPTPPEDLHDQVHEAVTGCPRGAIQLNDETPVPKPHLTLVQP